jgi:nucleoside-diphosphate-sugar epimerase
MRILLIGATGQIGYSLAKALAQTTHHITVLVRDRTKRPFPETVRVFESRSFNLQAFRRALSGINHVIYSVGLPEQYVPDTNVFERVNLGLFKAFLAEMAHAGPSALTYISTYEVFQAINGVIRESHPVASENGFSPYFQAMIRAYRLVKDFAVRHDVHLVTIHPAAVYGGLNTGEGFTSYIENLLHKRFWRVPFVFDGRFPVVHADSLAEAIIASMSGEGAYIVSEQMTTLKAIATVLRQRADSYVPLNAPVKMARAGATVLEWVSRLARTRPIMARVQIDFITQGIEPISERIIDELGWRPRTLDEGLAKYLEMRPTATSAGSSHVR